MKIKFTILLLLLLNVLHAQDGSGESNLCIEVAPLSWLVNLEGYSYQAGAEIKLYKNFSGYFAGAGYFPRGDGFRSSDLKGYNIRLEIKYYLNREQTGQYFSLEGMYKNQQFNYQDSIHITPAYLTNFRVFKNISCLTVKYGCQFLHKSRIVVDCYCGLGVRFKNIRTTLTPLQVSGLRNSNDDPYDSDEMPYFFYPGVYIVPNFEAGFKIGYQIK